MVNNKLKYSGGGVIGKLITIDAINPTPGSSYLKMDGTFYKIANYPKLANKIGHSYELFKTNASVLYRPPVAKGSTYLSASNLENAIVFWSPPKTVDRVGYSGNICYSVDGGKTWFEKNDSFSQSAHYSQVFELVCLKGYAFLSYLIRDVRGSSVYYYSGLNRLNLETGALTTRMHELTGYGTDGAYTNHVKVIGDTLYYNCEREDSSKKELKTVDGTSFVPQTEDDKAMLKEITSYQKAEEYEFYLYSKSKKIDMKLNDELIKTVNYTDNMTDFPASIAMINGKIYFITSDQRIGITDDFSSVVFKTPSYGFGKQKVISNSLWLPNNVAGKVINDNLIYFQGYGLYDIKRNILANCDSLNNCIFANENNLIDLYPNTVKVYDLKMDEFYLPVLKNSFENMNFNDVYIKAK